MTDDTLVTTGGGSPVKASLPRTKCIACGQRKQTYRVGPKPVDRACGDCIRGKAVPAVSPPRIA